MRREIEKKCVIKFFLRGKSKVREGERKGKYKFFLCIYIPPKIVRIRRENS